MLDKAGFRTGSHNVQKEELADSQSSDSNTPRAGVTSPNREVIESRRSKSKQRNSIGVVRARPVSAGRKTTSRTQSNQRRNSSENLYASTKPENMLPSGAAGEGGMEDVSLAQLQEMRERSKVLREQVLQVQRTVQTKEGQLQRLKNERLPPDEIRQENEKLARLQERINMQEARLRKLKETKSKIAQQVIINNNINAELDGLKNNLSSKEKEMVEIDQVINQLNSKLHQAKTENANKNSKRAHNLNRIEKLRQEMLSHKRVTESVQGKFSTQREAVQNKKEEMNKVDLQIAELWRKLQQAKAQQQAPQKSATAIAAVGPFEHKPLVNSAPVDNSLPAPHKPHEIDIKLVERNGGSGQSSPNISADEREPYSVQTVKPPPIPPTVSGTANSPRNSPRLMSSFGKRLPAAEQSLTTPNANYNGARTSPTQLSSLRSSSSDQLLRSEGNKNGAAPGIPHSSSDSNLHNHSPSRTQQGNSTPQANRINSPVLRVTSPRTAPVGEMKLEKGPVRQFKQIPQQPKPKASETDNKPKNFNAKPRPFGVPPTPQQLPQNSPPIRTEPVQKPSQNIQQPKNNVLDSSLDNRTQPQDISNQSTDDAKRGREMVNSTSIPQRVYPATPIMGRQQLNSNSGPGSPQHIRGSNNMSPQQQALDQSPNTQGNESSHPKMQSPRYATRSQISDTYIPQVNRDRLEQYRRDMERAVRDASSPPVIPPSNSPPTLDSLPKPPSPPSSQSSQDLSAPQPGEDIILPPPPIPDSPSPPTLPVETASVEVKNDERLGAETDSANNSLTVSEPAVITTPAVPPPPPPAQPVLGDIISTTLSNSREDRRRKTSPEDDIVEIYATVDHEQMKNVKPIIKKRRDTVDGALLSTSRFDNARFHPLVILLDTALNGTVDEVQDILPRVPDPSSSNDEGITALHNAICAGHLDIVQTLVEFGVDVNAVDTDGWTPLHCAASCNNQPVVEYLVSRGACILATTYSDSETAREKCEMDEEGYDGTSKSLYNMEMKLGLVEQVYCVYDYKAESEDELTLRINDRMTILRRGDKHEQDWWWARCGDNEGYVAKNLLAFTPRVKPKYTAVTQPGS